jgi:hypothetical protein
VDGGGKAKRAGDFLRNEHFSTGFAQFPVDEKRPINREFPLVFHTFTGTYY